MTPPKKSYIRILHVISDTYSISGPSNSLLTFLDHLSRDRYVSYVALREPGTLASELEERKIPCLFLSLPKPSGLQALYFCVSFPLAVLKLIGFIQRHKIDIVHVHQTQSVWGLLAGKFAGVPVVFHVREILGSRLLKRGILRLATRLIAISHAVQDSLKKLSPSSQHKIFVVYNAVDPDRFNADNHGGKIRDEFGIPKGNPLVLMISKLIALKGHLDFVRSCELVHQQFPEAIFMIVGGVLPGHEGYAKDVEQAVKTAGLQQVFRFAGFRRDIEQFLAAAAVVVQPSRCDEGLGRVAIEAMALAKPVVATRSGGLQEVVLDSKTGYLVPKICPEVLAERIITLLRTPQLRMAFGQAGFVRFKELFHISDHVQAIAGIYEELVSPNKHLPVNFYDESRYDKEKC